MFADIELLPHTYIVTSENQKVYFKMYADYEDYSNEGFGEAFIISNNSEDSLIWKTNGWYASGVYISNDGHYLVRPGLWPLSPMDTNDLAVAFYKDGKLLKSYSTPDLVKNVNKVEYSVSHYRYYYWFKFYPYKNQLRIITVDNLIYTFNITTGEILSIENDFWLFKKLRSVDDVKIYGSLIIISLILGIILGILIYLILKRFCKKLIFKQFSKKPSHQAD